MAYTPVDGMASGDFGGIFSDYHKLALLLVRSQQKKSARAKQGPKGANITPVIGNAPFEDSSAVAKALEVLRQAQQLLERQLAAGSGTHSSTHSSPTGGGSLSSSNDRQVL
jgi:hypothetical protein